MLCSLYTKLDHCTVYSSLRPECSEDGVKANLHLSAAAFRALARRPAGILCYLLSFIAVLPSSALTLLLFKSSMSDAAWFGLSHGRAWGDVGQSFCELADPQFSQLSSSPSPEAPLIAAGTRSSAKPKGAGSFQLQVCACLVTDRPPADLLQSLRLIQTEWHLSDRPEANTYNTEASDRFRQPPKSARPAVCDCTYIFLLLSHFHVHLSNACCLQISQAARGKSSSFPKETYPTEFR